MPGDRLNQLIKQKQLLEEHMAWLEQEIAKEQGKPEPAIPASRLESSEELEQKEAPKTPVTPEPEVDPEELTPEQTAADIYQELGPEASSSAQDARKSCLLIMIIGTVIVGGILALIYYFYEP